MTVETHEFKAEMKRMMELIVHSLYSNEEIFLRELISNASDAIDKIRFQSITEPEVLEGDGDWKIKILADSEAGTLTIRDNGIGMDRDSVIENIGTVAKSGTSAFLAKLQETDAANVPELIGQFGLGFYSSFIVADEVTVESRMAGDPNAGVRWKSDGEGEYSIETIEKATRGTDVILHLKEDKKDYLNEWRVQNIVKKFSDFIEHPVVMDVEIPPPPKEEGENGDAETAEPTIEEKTLNSGQAIWLRNKAEVKPEEYHDFYKHLSKDMHDPAKVIHYSAEGNIEFKALLFIPQERPFALFEPERKNGLNLYIKRVFVMDDCEDLLPPYLRFVHGVVDASDLPLNVSRELLQQNRVVETIRKNLVGKILSSLKDMLAKDYDNYLKFYKNFGAILKEGIYIDWNRSDDLAELALYPSVAKPAGEFVTLQQYYEAMPSKQEEIYYLVGENRETLEKSPYLESLREKGFDVLLMTDPVDEWAIGSLREYKGKPFKAIDKGDIKLDDEEKAEEEEKKKTFGNLLEFLNQTIEPVSEVRLSHRLKESAACLVAREEGNSAYMENLMKRLGREDEIGVSPRILEINPDHPAVKTLHTLFEANAEDPKVADFSWLLYDQAVLAEGSKVQDPQAFARRVNDLIVRSGLL